MLGHPPQAVLVRMSSSSPSLWVRRVLLRGLVLVSLASSSFCVHVLRDKNKNADFLANLGADNNGQDWSYPQTSLAVNTKRSRPAEGSGSGAGAGAGAGAGNDAVQDGTAANPICLDIDSEEEAKEPETAVRQYCACPVTYCCTLHI